MTAPRTFAVWSTTLSGENVTSNSIAYKSPQVTAGDDGVRISLGETEGSPETDLVNDVTLEDSVVHKTVSLGKQAEKR